LGAPETTTLEVCAEFAEGRKNYQLARAGDHGFVFELPGVLVRDVNCIQADLHGGVDVASRTVSYHPAVRLDDFVFAHKLAVSVRTFFRDDLDELEEALQAGTLDFGSLLGGLAFGEKNQAMAFSKVGESFRDAIEDFRRGALEIDDAGVNLREDFALRKIPTASFAANALYLEIIRFAYNLVTAFQRICLQESWQNLTLGKLRYKLFLLPGELTRPQNRPVLRLRESPMLRDLIGHILDCISELKPIQT